MKIILRMTALALALLGAGAARADLKIGYVDGLRAMSELDEARAAQEQIKAEYADKQKQLNARQEEVERAGADYEKQKPLLTEQAQREKENELRGKVEDLQRLLVAKQREVAEREREIMGGINRKVEIIVKEIAEANGLTFVLDASRAGIIYAPPSLDLTNELVRKYNARYPVGKAARPAAKNDKPADKPAPPAAPKK